MSVAPAGCRTVDLSLFDPSFLGGQLHADQLAGIDFLVRTPRALLADAPGRGKTAQLAGLIAHLAASDQLAARESRYALYVVPSTSLANQIRHALERLCPTLTVSDWTDPKVKKDGVLGDVIIVTYALLNRRVDRLVELELVAVIGDEASALKSAGPMHAAFARLASSAERAVMVTATPYEIHPLELHAILTAAGIDIGSRDFWGQTLCFIDGVRKDGSIKYGQLQPSEAETLRLWIRPWTLRRTGPLPGVRYPKAIGTAYRFVKPSPAQRTQLDAAERISDPLRSFQRAKAATAFVGEGDGRESAKATAIMCWLLSRPEVDKAIVYSERTETLDVIERLFAANGITTVRVDGGDTRKSRLDAVEQFRTDRSIRVLLGTSVLGRGLNLQFCRVILAHDGFWNPAAAEQLEGRICRPGSLHRTYEFVTFLLDHPHDLKRKVRAARRAEESKQITTDTSAFHTR